MSYITVSAEKVTLAANATIDRIMQKRNKLDEKKITDVMSKVRYRFFFLKLAPFTREEAINYLDNEEYYWHSEYAWGDLQKARNLLIMAENGDPVNIDNDDARVLWGNK